MRALSESCRMVQGSKQTFRCIPSEQRTEPRRGSRLRRARPIQRIRVPGSRNESGTAEV